MNALDTAIFGQLASGSALTTALGGTAIYNNMPPRDGTLPWVTFTLTSALEDSYNRTRTLRMNYLVQGVASTMYEAGQLADLIDARLHNQEKTITVSGATLFEVTRKTVVRYQETDPAGHVIGHAGGEYVFRMQLT